MDSDGFEATERWVRDEIGLSQQAGVVHISSVAVHAGSDRAACIVRVMEEPSDTGSDRVALVDLDSGHWTILDLDIDGASRPAWSNDGHHLAILIRQDKRHTVWVLEVGHESEAPRQVYVAPSHTGSVEALAWANDDSQLALVIAQPGAEISDVYGSGTVDGHVNRQTWRPLLSPSPEGGRRVLHTWNLASQTLSPVEPELNVWETSWLGTHLIVLGSGGAGEGAWYKSRLFHISPGERPKVVLSAPQQLAQPTGSPDGTHWSVLMGHASDRGLLAGSIVIGSGDTTRRCDTAGTDVTDHLWIDDHHILYAGTRQQRTVFALYDLETDQTVELLDTEGTSGLHQPELGGYTRDGALVIALEYPDRPACLTMIRGTAHRELVATDGPGTKYLVSRTGSTTSHEWKSKDGLVIGGFVTVPDGNGPHPLVVNIHGGPVAAWHNGWLGKDPYTTLLVSRGYAVLRPNPRGSTGRGDDFVAAIFGQIGGDDVDDILTGVASLVDSGIADPARVGVTGNSYGGYMAAWLPCVTDVFAATVARSPVTEWISQHWGSNLAEFDRIFVGGEPLDADSNYTQRSPLRRHADVETPILFTAGAKDLATPAFQAQLMHQALDERGIPTVLAIYPEEGHGVHGENALADQLARMLDWFDTHL